MADPQIDYTSRDYAGLKADLISLVNTRTGLAWDAADPNDLGSVLIETFAYMGDIMSYYLDRIANETSIDTATQRSNLLSFAALYGYKPTGPTPATVRISFTNLQDTDTIDIPIGTQVMALLSYANYTEAFFETTEAATAVLPGQTVSLACVEGKTVNTDRPDLIDPNYNKPLPIIIGNSDGTASQEINIIDIGVVDSSLVVYIGQDVAFSTWKYVDSLIESGPLDLVFTTRQNEDGTITVIFGDGITGQIPGNGQVVSATYRTSVGVAGNISANSVSEVTFIPGNPDAEAISFLQATNPAAAVGGADADNNAQLKAKIKAAISARKRAVTLADYEYLLSLVSGVGKVKAESAVYSVVNTYLQSPNDFTSTPGIYVQTGSVTNVTGDGTYITVTTASNHLYSVGEIVTIVGVNPTAYNLIDAVIYDTPSTTTFRIANTTTTAFVSGGTVSGTQPTANWNAAKTAAISYMADKIPVGTTLTINSPVYVPIYLGLNVTAKDAYQASTVKLNVYKAMLGTGGLFDFDNNTFGRRIHSSNVITAASNADGVDVVDIVQLNRDGSASAGNIDLDAYEVPYLLAANLAITVVGGIQ
jgi:hypothetical protein